MRDGSNQRQASGLAGMSDGAMTPAKKHGYPFLRSCAFGMLFLACTPHEDRGRRVRK